jgi:RNA polymerase sigma factor (sigma-70 family)
METAIASDADLIDASRRGERAAFGALVERYATMVSAVSYAGVRDRALGEDVAQDTFVAAWRELDRLRDSAAVRPWLCGIARNLARKACRQRSREVAAAEPDAVDERTAFDAIHDEQAEALVAAALERVPEAYREVLVMFYYEQRSTKEVGDALGLSEHAVHKRLSRGRRFLAAGLEDSVERVLAAQPNRKDRKNLAACVLAALPVRPAVVPHAETATATKGWRMLKLGALGMAAAAMTAGTVVTWSHYGANSAQASPTSGETAAAAQGPATGASVGTHATVQAAPALAASATITTAGSNPTGGAAADCAKVAKHVARLSLAAWSVGPLGKKTKWIKSTLVSQFEQSCKRAAWSLGTVACVMAARDIWNANLCDGTQPPTAPLPPLAAGSDTSCAAVAAHGAALDLSDFEDVAPTLELAAVEAQRPVISSMLEEVCTRDAWTEEQRRCALAATSAFAVHSCVRRDVQAPTPAPANVDAACTAVAQHMQALANKSLSALDTPALAANVRVRLDHARAGMADQIATACVDGAWSESLRRCLLGATENNQLHACHK